MRQQDTIKVLTDIFHFIKKHRTVLMAMAVVVVFITTYVLILPAMTLDKEEAQAQGGIDLPQTTQAADEDANTGNDGADSTDKVSASDSNDAQTADSSKAGASTSETATAAEATAQAEAGDETTAQAQIEAEGSPASYRVAVTAGEKLSVRDMLMAIGLAVDETAAGQIIDDIADVDVVSADGDNALKVTHKNGNLIREEDWTVQTRDELTDEELLTIEMKDGSAIEVEVAQAGEYLINIATFDHGGILPAKPDNIYPIKGDYYLRVKVQKMDDINAFGSDVTWSDAGWTAIRVGSIKSELTQTSVTEYVAFDQPLDGENAMLYDPAVCRINPEDITLLQPTDDRWTANWDNAVNPDYVDTTTPDRYEAAGGEAISGGWQIDLKRAMDIDYYVRLAYEGTDSVEEIPALVGQLYTFVRVEEQTATNGEPDVVYGFVPVTGEDAHLADGRAVVDVPITSWRKADGTVADFTYTGSEKSISVELVKVPEGAERIVPADFESGKYATLAVGEEADGSAVVNYPTKQEYPQRVTKNNLDKRHAVNVYDVVTLTTDEEQIAKAQEEAAAKAEEAAEETETVTAEEAEEQAKEQTDTEAKAGTLTFEGADYTVTATYGEDAGLPEATELSVREITANDNEYQAWYEETQQAIRNDAGLGETKSLQFAKFYDITFSVNGEEIEPAAPVDVTISYDGAPEVADTDNVKVLHFGEDSKGNLQPEVLDEDSVDATVDDDSRLSETSFTADSFSVYAVAYTVDFAYGEYAYSITGGSKIKLSELFVFLGIDEDVKDVIDVTFTDESLVKVSKDLLGDDWTLTSLEPFTSFEKLTITFADREIVVEVTDDQDISDYISSINFYKIDADGTAHRTNSFNSGDSAKIQIDFSIGSNKLTDRTLIYQLPASIQVTSPIETVARNSSGERVGLFKVGTDGKIRLVFDNSYDISKAFDGEIVFNAKVANTSGDSTQQVKFGDAISITIQPEAKPKNTDLAISKKGTLNSNNTINYDITISSNKGSDGEINFTDWLYQNGASFDYELRDGQSIAITKVDAYGNRSTFYRTIVKDGLSFRIDSLPALGAGESYTFGYSSKIEKVTSSNGYASVSNSARAQDKSNGSTDSSWQKISEAEISKNATTENGKVKWTIYVGKDGEDLSGYTLTDTLTKDGKKISLPSTIKVNGNDATMSNGKYTFPNGTKGVVTITYYSDYTSDSPEQFHNEATITRNGTTYHTGVDYKPGQTTPTAETYNVTKVYNGSKDNVQLANDGTAILPWKATIEMPQNEKDLGQITYTDKMTSYDGNYATLAGEHYTTEKLLNESLVVKRENGEALIRGTDYVVYDSDANVVAADSTKTDIMTGFTIRFLSADKFVSDKSISVEYESIATLGMNTGEQWTFSNRGKIPAANSTANFEYAKKGKLDKQTSIKDGNKDARSGNSDSYKSGVTQLDDKDGTIYYRLVLDTENTEKKVTENIVVNDVLPEGLTYVAGSFEAYYRGWTIDETYDHFDNLLSQLSNDGTALNDSNNVSCNYNEAARTLTIKINKASKEGRYIEIYYAAKVDDDAYWSDFTNQEKEYTNTASWGDVSDSETVVVTNKEDILKKTGSVVKVNAGKDDEKTTLTYSLIINPQAADLVQYADTIQLEDVLSNSSNTTVTNFIPTSVAVYQYDRTKADGKGDKLSSARYKFTYDSAKKQLAMTLPDEMGLVVEYQYEVPMIDAVNATNIENSAKIIGVVGASSSDEQKFSTEDGRASVKRRELDLYKVDSADYTKGLAGAQFKIEQYNKSSKSWETIKKNGSDRIFTTDAEGHLYVNGATDADNLPADTLYRISETQAPENYIKSDKVFYFIWKGNSGTSKEDEFYKATGVSWYETSQSNDPNGLTKIKEVINYSVGEITYYVPNEYQNLDIQKIWIDAEGKELSSSDTKVPNEATFTLYRQAKDLTGYTVNVTYNMVSGGKISRTTGTQTVLVAPGSSLTITIDQSWLDESCGFIVDDGEEVTRYGGSGSVYNLNDSSNPYRPAVIEYQNINRDMDIVISHDYQFWTPVLSNYTIAHDYALLPGTREVVDSNISLNKGNGFKTTINKNLQKTYTADGKTYDYYYWVEENSVPHGWNVSYSVDSSSGVKVGDSITVTNQKESGTEFTVQKRWMLTDGSWLGEDYDDAEHVIYYMLLRKGSDGKYHQVNARGEQVNNINEVFSLTKDSTAQIDLTEAETVTGGTRTDVTSAGEHTVHWAHTFTKLPGNKDEYYAIECSADGKRIMQDGGLNGGDMSIIALTSEQEITSANTQVYMGCWEYRTDQISNGVLALKNNLTETQAKKIWDDNGAAGAEHPEVKLKLYRTTDDPGDWSSNTNDGKTIGYSGSARWELVDDTATIAAGATGNDLIYKWNNLPKIDPENCLPYYYMVEEVDVDGYVLKSANKFGAWPSYEFVFENLRQSTELKLIKVDESNTNQTLSGAKFTIQKVKISDKQEIVPVGTATEQTTGNDGKLEFTGLTTGYYEITETEAPDGYVISDDPVFYVQVNGNTITLVQRQGETFEAVNGTSLNGGHITMKARTNNSPAEVTVTNESGTELPQTGGSGTLWIYLLGSILILGCGIVLVARRRNSVWH